MQRHKGSLGSPRAQMLEGSEGCSCPRAVPQRGKTEAPEPDILYKINSNIALKPPAVSFAHSSLTSVTSIHLPGLRKHECGFLGMLKNSQQWNSSTALSAALVSVLQQLTRYHPSDPCRTFEPIAHGRRAAVSCNCSEASAVSRNTISSLIDF